VTNLLKLPAKICLTAGGCLIHDHKVLLIKHRKLGVWLCPGGHIEPNELPHQAAEREFWEETGMKVKAKQFGLKIDILAIDNQQLPLPISHNLHWISQENYHRRIKGISSRSKNNVWPSGCEQHANQLFLVEPIGSLAFKENQEEVDGISWFCAEELDSLETYGQIKNELKYAFGFICDR